MPEIIEIEKLILSCQQVEMPVSHYHIDGVYVRSLFIPADTVLTGKIHNFESIAILAQGTIKIANGNDAYEITAPAIMVDKPGIKRIGYAVTDVTFITVHKTDKKEVPDIEEQLVSATFEEYETKKLEVMA